MRRSTTIGRKTTLIRRMAAMTGTRTRTMKDAKRPNLHRGRRTSSNLVNYLKDNDKDERDSSLRSLCTHGASDSLYVWSEETMNELKRRGGNLQRLQLDAVSYLWEICHDLLLEKNSNVSISPGFESLGLRLKKKRKIDDE